MRESDTVALQMSISDWINSLGVDCLPYAETLRSMGYGKVQDIVAASPRPDQLKAAGVAVPSARRRIWHATQRLRLQGSLQAGKTHPSSEGASTASSLRTPDSVSNLRPRPHTERHSRPSVDRIDLTPDTASTNRLQLPTVDKADAIRPEAASAQPVDDSTKLRNSSPQSLESASLNQSVLIPRPPRGRSRRVGRELRRSEVNGRVVPGMAKGSRPNNQWVRRTIRQVDAPFEGEFDRRWREKAVVDVEKKLAAHKVEMAREVERAEQKWETQVEPWIEHRRLQKAAGRWDTILKRARKERNDMKKLREHRRRVREETGRQLLKDMGYFMEQTQKQATWDTPEMISQRLKWQEEIDEYGRIIRAQQLESTSLDMLKAKHEAVVAYIFNLFDADGGGSLDEHEISALAKCLGGRKLSSVELAAAMEEMDADGGGDVSFEEFYSWWMRRSPNNGQPQEANPSALAIDTSGGGEPFTITIVRFKN